MFLGIKFPYMTTQQLNLDWLLDRVANMPEIVHVPALAGDDIGDVMDMIDLKALDIPKGFSFMQAGQPDDALDRQCLCLIFKADKDNIIGFVMGHSANINLNGLKKEAGVWQ